MPERFGRSHLQTTFGHSVGESELQLDEELRKAALARRIVRRAIQLKRRQRIMQKRVDRPQQRRGIERSKVIQNLNGVAKIRYVQPLKWQRNSSLALGTVILGTRGRWLPSLGRRVRGRATREATSSCRIPAFR